MDLDLKDKLVVITGGTQGIGGAIAQAVAREGGKAISIGRNRASGEAMMSLFQERSWRGDFVQGDLSQPGSCEKMVAQIREEHGQIHALVNNAGANDGVALESGSPERFTKSLNNNLLHYYEMAHHCLPSLKQTRGNILNISSKVALTGQGGTSGYAAAKGAQLALTREWAAELLPYGIRVNAICPAEVMTPLYRSWLQGFEQPEKKLQEITSKIPLGNRMTTAEEIADLAVFLLSSRSGHTTGEFFFPDGGYVHLDRMLT